MFLKGKYHVKSMFQRKRKRMDKKVQSRTISSIAVTGYYQIDYSNEFAVGKVLEKNGQ